MSEQEGGTRPEEEERLGGPLERLAASRLPIAVLALLLLAFLLAGAISSGPALLLFVALSLSIVAVPRGLRDRPLRLASRPPPSVRPDAGTRQMADALPEPCVILDRRCVVRYANRFAETAFPVRPGEPVMFRMRAPDFVRAFERVAAGGPAERVEFLERVPTERWYEAWFSAIEPRGEDRAGFVALIVSDQTERRRSEKVRADFVANASHELRTPLASLAGFIETLQGPARDDAVARDRFLAIMHDQATRMSRLIDDLLSLSRVEMKAHMHPDQPVDLVAVLRSVADAMGPLAGEQGVRIETDLPSAPLVVAGDRDELVQVFQNLVENACKYGRAGGRVRIEAKAAGAAKTIVASVRDFGPGIPAEHLPRLTERFYRPDIEASRAARGTGLGLAIVKHILNRHRARLLIESRLGEGSVFSVELPAPAAGELASPDGKAEPEQGVRLS